jgi:hypothetical protein
MFSSKPEQPRTVDQITQNLQTMVDELSVSESQYEELTRSNQAEIAKRQLQNDDISFEVERNRKVSAKLAALFGGE